MPPAGVELVQLGALRRNDESLVRERPEERHDPPDALVALVRAEVDASVGTDCKRCRELRASRTVALLFIRWSYNVRFAALPTTAFFGFLSTNPQVRAGLETRGSERRSLPLYESDEISQRSGHRVPNVPCTGKPIGTVVLASMLKRLSLGESQGDESQG
jgi:hypothetical protein